MDILQDRYVILLRKVSSFLGIWPIQTYKERFLRTCIVSFMILYLVLSQLCQVLTLDFDLRSIITTLQMFIPSLCTACTYYVVLVHFITIQTASSYFINDWLQIEDDIELEIMQKYFNESKLFSKIAGSTFYLFVCTSAFPFIRIIISTNEITDRTYRYPIFSCFDYFLGQDRYYYPTIIYQILTLILMSTVSATCYSLYFWLIQHVCARLCILQIKIRQPFEIDQYKDNDHKEPLDLSDWILGIIQYLSRTRELNALLNKLSGNVYLFQMLMAFVLLIIDLVCVSATWILEMPFLLHQKETRKDAFAFLFFIVDTTFIIFVNYHIGQRLIDNSNDVYKEICLLPFHKISLKTQKLLLTVLTMNAKPCAISIGKMFVSSHECFSDLLRMSLSFALVVRSIHEI